MKDYKKAITQTEVTLVEFYATWCPHCQRMKPIVEAVKEKLKGKVNVLRYDIDKNTELADSLNIQNIPTFIVYNNGDEISRRTGEMTEQSLMQQVMKNEPVK